MSLRVRSIIVAIGLVAGTHLAAATAEELPEIVLKARQGEVLISVGGTPLATYVYQDDEITRPYFANVREPGGVQVTRNHPPQKGDTQDHATFHPGLWLAFGDVSGHDYWRLKARVVHDAFVESPRGGAGQGTFTVRNRYLTTGGERTLCRETCRYTFLVRPHGYLLLWDSTFVPEDDEIVFGDQEEMGLGVRVATPLAVEKEQGGRILDSHGRRNEREVWGKQSDWCDYSGVVGGRRVGVTLMSHPKNFRRSWNHARDYGFTTANPFGRHAMTGGKKSRVVVRQGESLRLRFGVLLHGAAEDRPVDLKAAYADYLAQAAERAAK